MDKIEQLEKRISVIEMEMKQGYETIKWLCDQLSKNQNTGQKKSPKKTSSDTYRQMEFKEYVNHAFQKAVKSKRDKYGEPAFGLEEVLVKVGADESFTENWNKFIAGDNGARPTMFLDGGKGIHHLKFNTAGAFATKFRKKGN